MEEKICGTAVNGHTFETALRKYFGEGCPALESLHAEQIAKGEGYTSKIVRVYLKWKEKKNFENLPKSVILKAPSGEALDSLLKAVSGGQEQNVEGMASIAKALTNVETMAYRVLGPLNLLPMPICFAANEWQEKLPGFLILEDLGQMSVITEKGDLPMSLEQLMNVVKLITDLHLWSLTTDVQLMKHFPTVEQDKENLILFLEIIKQGISSMKLAYTEEFKELNEEKVKQLFDVDNFIKQFDNHVGVIPPVVVHGDFWSNNIMFKRNAHDGKASSEVFAIIDWQVASLGSCMADFGRLLSEFPQTFLDAHIDKILQNYCETMKRKAGSKFDVTYDQIKSMFDIHLGLNALQYVAMGSAMLISTNGEVNDEEESKRQKLKRAVDNYKMAKKLLDV